MLAKISKAIDTINTKQGDVTSLLILPLAIVVFYEVIMRYVFNAPTIWGFEATIFLYGLHFMFGYSYTEVLEGNVKVDIFTSRMSEKNPGDSEYYYSLRFFPARVFLPDLLCLSICLNVNDAARSQLNQLGAAHLAVQAHHGFLFLFTADARGFKRAQEHPCAYRTNRSDGKGVGRL